MATAASGLVGVRVTGIASSVTDRDLRVYFSNPERGGGAIDKIHYPLLGNDAVILFKEGFDTSKLCELHKVSDESQLLVHPTPKQVFSHVEAKVLPSWNSVLEEDSDVLDELRYYADINVSKTAGTGCYLLVGDIYQIEWAMQFLSVIASKKTDTSGQKSEKVLEKEMHKITRNPKPKKTKAIEVENQPKGSIFESSKAEEKFGKQCSETMTEERSINLSEDREDPPEQAIGISTALQDEYELKRKVMEQKKANSEEPYIKQVDNDQFDWSSDDDGKSGHNYDIPNKDCIDVYRADFGGMPLSFEFQLKNLVVKIDFDDITKARTDGIVSPVQSSLIGHHNGISRAIAMAAGSTFNNEWQAVVAERRLKEIGDVYHTCAGGSIDKKVVSVLHTLVPLWTEERSEYVSHALTVTYLNCLHYANFTLWMKSLTFPLLGAGYLGIPLDICVHAFYDALEVSVADARKSRHLSEIRLVANDANSAGAIIAILQSLLDMGQHTGHIAALERFIEHSKEFNFYAKDLQLESKRISKPLKQGQTNTNQTGPVSPKPIANSQAEQPPVYRGFKSDKIKNEPLKYPGTKKGDPQNQLKDKKSTQQEQDIKSFPDLPNVSSGFHADDKISRFCEDEDETIENDFGEDEIVKRSLQHYRKIKDCWKEVTVGPEPSFPGKKHDINKGTTYMTSQCDNPKVKEGKEKGKLYPSLDDDDDLKGNLSCT